MIDLTIAIGTLVPGVEEAITHIVKVGEDAYGTLYHCTALLQGVPTKHLLRKTNFLIEKEDFESLSKTFHEKHFLMPSKLLSSDAVLTPLGEYKSILLENATDIEDGVRLVPMSDYEAHSIAFEVRDILEELEKAGHYFFSINAGNLYYGKTLVEDEESFSLLVGEPYLVFSYSTNPKDVFIPKDFNESKKTAHSWSIGCLSFELLTGRQYTDPEDVMHMRHSVNCKLTESLLEADHVRRRDLDSVEMAFKCYDGSEELKIYEQMHVKNLITDRGTYTGDMKYGVPHGKGLLYLCERGERNRTDMIKYDGFFCFGKMHIMGSVFYKNGDYYDGEIQWEERHGFGVFIEEAQKTTGKWVKGSLDHKARNLITYSNNSSYDGLCSAFGVKHGYGVFKDTDGSTYDGEFNYGKREGEGTFTLGSYSYKGEWLENHKHGKGVETTDDYTYTGEFNRGNKQGEGRKEFTNGDVYTGEFERNVEEGYGEMVFKDGTVYKGQWRKGKANGEGVYISANSDWYKGMFVDGCKEGYGVWTKSSGRETYKGEWKDDFKEGYGAWTDEEGVVYEGNFSRGQMAGEMTVTTPDGNVNLLLYVDGELVENFDQEYGYDDEEADD